MGQGCALWWTVTSWCTEACPHHHARLGIQTKVRSPFSDVALCCEAQAAAVSHGVSTTSNAPSNHDVRLAPNPSSPQPPPFSPLDIHPHPSHLGSQQTPHLAPPLLPAPPALKSARPDSPPPASRPPQGAMRTDTASPEALEAHDATERETKQPRLQNSEARPRHSDDASLGMPMAKANTAHDHEHALVPDQCREAAQYRRPKPDNWPSVSSKHQKNWRKQNKK
jgi:hypothetical protein